MTVQYKCDICKTIHTTEKSALDCEAQGVFDVSEYPIGTMFEYHHNGYIGVFAIATVDGGHLNGHLGQTRLWAARVTGYGDSLEHVCGGDLVRTGSFEKWRSFHVLTDEKVNTPEYDRMVTHIRSQGITPTYYTKSGQLISL